MIALPHRPWRAAWAALLLAALALGTARAGEAPPVAEDPALEARVTRLAEELRCLVCQNQTIADSHSGLANDLKQQIREQLRAGRTDRQVLDFMVERFGDFVLYRPPVKSSTAVLWYGPFALLVLGGVVAWRVVRRHRRDALPAAPLGEGERARAAALLDGAAADVKGPR